MPRTLGNVKIIIHPTPMFLTFSQCLANEVLTGMLDNDPVTRWSLEEVMRSPWLD